MKDVAITFRVNHEKKDKLLKICANLNKRCREGHKIYDPSMMMEKKLDDIIRDYATFLDDECITP